MSPYEEKYSPLEKTCVALVWATCKLRHYMLAYKVLLITRMDLLKYLMEKHVQDEEMAIADHLVHCSPEEAEEIQRDF